MTILAENTNFDLNELRGSSANIDNPNADEPDDDLNALSELVPHLKNRNTTTSIVVEDTSSPEGQELKHVEPVSGGMHIPTTNSPRAGKGHGKRDVYVAENESSSDAAAGDGEKDINDVLYAGEDVNSEQALSSDDDHSKPRPPDEASENLGLGEFQNISSGQSLSTATQTHEVRMPMYLPTFKPATGCTNASDFIVRCFVARLRSGITVVKHGRSRWCKSRLRILHIHPDGRSLSWKPAQGEPTSSKRPPKLDLTTCLEVRHAWSPDPQNPMYTGTPILRQKCEAANAHKSFALIFPKRTVDITSVTADQCKVLMEGFSALCFRLQVANLAGKGTTKGAQKMPDEEDDRATTASATLTNNSANLSPHNRR
jgi:hypothetical protein